MNDEARDELLIRLDERMEKISADVSELKVGIYGQDGRGGICGEIQCLRDRQMRWLGRDGAIVAGISGVMTAIGIGLQIKGGS